MKLEVDLSLIENFTITSYITFKTYKFKEFNPFKYIKRYPKSCIYIVHIKK